MTEYPGKAGSATDSGGEHDFARDLDLFEFARAARRAAGQVRVSQLPRMVNEVLEVSEVLAEMPAQARAKAPDAVFTWQAEGVLQPELQDDGAQRAQPYLRLAVQGSAWLACQRCLAPYEQTFDVDATFRIAGTEQEANAFPLDDDETDVIVGSRHFDLVDLVEEELLLALPLVPKHEVCPAIHASLVSGADGSRGVDSVDDLDEDAFPASLPEDEGEGESEGCFTGSAENPGAGSAGLARTAESAGAPRHPFAVLERLRKNGSGEPH